LALLALSQATDDTRKASDAVRDLGQQFSGGGRTKPVKRVCHSFDTKAVYLVHRVGSIMGADWLEMSPAPCYTLNTTIENSNAAGFRQSGPAV
jgi:hypothetical protein